MQPGLHVPWSDSGYRLSAWVISTMALLIGNQSCYLVIFLTWLNLFVRFSHPLHFDRFTFSRHPKQQVRRRQIIRRFQTIQCRKVKARTFFLSSLILSKPDFIAQTTRTLLPHGICGTVNPSRKLIFLQGCVPVDKDKHCSMLRVFSRSDLRCTTCLWYAR